MPARASAQDAGYTLIELLVAMSLMGALMAISVIGFDKWTESSQQSGSARELQSLMRKAQQRAITDGTALCVQFDDAGDTYTLKRGACASPGATLEGPLTLNGDKVHLATPVFTGTTAPTGATFFARGTATPGTVQVTRDGSTKVYTVEVEGLTGRVSLS